MCALQYFGMYAALRLLTCAAALMATSVTKPPVEWETTTKLGVPKSFGGGASGCKGSTTPVPKTIASPICARIDLTATSKLVLVIGKQAFADDSGRRSLLL